MPKITSGAEDLFGQRTQKLVFNNTSVLCKFCCCPTNFKFQTFYEQKQILKAVINSWQKQQEDIHTSVTAV